MTEQKSGIDRRSFIAAGLSLAAGMTMPVLPFSPAGEPKPERIPNYHPDMRYKRVGDTDAVFSVLSLGAFMVLEPVFRYAVGHGVNLFHCSPYYMDGRSLRALGKFIKPFREKVYVALKDEFEHIDDALRALDSDYIDFLMFNRHGKPVATDPKIRDTFEKYRAQGKVRYSGLTTHGDVKNATGAGIASGMYHAVMPALTPANLEAMGPELQLARSRGVGVIAMKFSRGIDDKTLEIAQFKKAVLHPAVTTAIRGINSFEDIVPYVKAAQEKLSGAELESLHRHALSHPEGRCMMCDACDRACPEGIPVSTLLRCHDYYLIQQNDRVKAEAVLAQARAQSFGSAACLNCRLCESACPNRIPIVGKMESARRAFGLHA
ncbi:aldo/keto reductase [bacterium]|nr:aldo/keto reductase [bacterium]